MTRDSTKALLDESDALLAAIRGGILLRLHDGIAPGDLIAPLESARTLKNCVAEFGDHRIGAAADTLEAWLALLITESEPLSSAKVASLLDQISELDAAMMRFRAETEQTPLDVAGFVDETFDVLRARTNTGASDLDVDTELLEVFREEAEGLLKEIRRNLEKLSLDARDAEALWEVKRSAHTLKGAAGVVGLKSASELAHRVEDLLERLPASETAPIERLVRLIVDATDCLEHLANGHDSPQLQERLGSLDQSFAEMVRSSTGHMVHQHPEDRRSGAPLHQHEADPNSTADSRIVRVSLRRLDNLVKDLINLIENRSAVVTAVAALHDQLGEAHRNMLRLQGTTAKIEKLRPVPDETLDRSQVGRAVYELTETARDTSLITSDLISFRDSLEDLLSEQNRLIESLRDRLMRLRKIEFGTIATRLDRTIRLTCEDEEKLAEVHIENSSLEVDTLIVDGLIEPLMHLLKNAVVHGIETPEKRRMLGKPETGRVAIAVRVEGPDFVVVVSDDGCGIAIQPLVDKALASGSVTIDEIASMGPEQRRELIFLPGVTTADRLSLNAGRGVGMSIVRQSIANMKGSITVQSLPQRGASFTIRIPLPFPQLAERGRSRTARPASDPTPHSRVVIVVDDSPSVRVSVSRMLVVAGWPVLVASNGVEALEKIDALAKPPAAVITDLEMPVMGGYELMRKLRENDALREVPVLILSSRNAADERENALAAGADEYLIKPCADHQVVEAIFRVTMEEPVPA